jgi:hypothetical protein
MDEILCSGFVLHFFMSGNVAKFRALRPNSFVLEKPFLEEDLGCAIYRALQSADAQRMAHGREARL